MKTKIRLLLILMALCISSVLFMGFVSAQRTNVSFQIFYDQLSPYGQWVDYPNYGYAWIPDAGPDFAPYSTSGYWVLTEYGMTWVSDYDWGWAPFHYGRWNYDNYYGWLWIPDNEWGPAWVTWRSASGYYGWEPMGYGISINMSFGRQYNNQNDHWIFVRERDIHRSDIHRYYVNHNDRERIIRNSTVINNTYVDNRHNTTYVAGPSRQDMQRATGKRINPVVVQDNNRPGENMSFGRYKIYRPQIVEKSGNGQGVAPSRVSNLKDVKRYSERGSANGSGIKGTRVRNSREHTPQPVNLRNDVKSQKTINQQNNTRPKQEVKQQRVVKKENAGKAKTTKVQGNQLRKRFSEITGGK